MGQRRQHIRRWKVEGVVVTETVDIGNGYPRAQRMCDTPAEDEKGTGVEALDIFDGATEV